MASGIFVGGKYAPKTHTVTTFVVIGLRHYYADKSNCRFRISKPHTRTDMPMVAPVILAYWSDEE